MIFDWLWTTKNKGSNNILIAVLYFVEPDEGLQDGDAQVQMGKMMSLIQVLWIP